MILKMKKYTFLVYHKEYTEFLLQLRELGLVHVAEKQGGVIEDDELQSDMQLTSRLKTAMRLLDRYDKSEQEAPPVNMDGYAFLDAIEKASQRREQILQLRQNVEKEMDKMAPWGVFNPQRIQQIKNAGFHIHFYVCPSNKFSEKWKSDFNAIEIDRINSISYFVTVTKEDTFDIDAEQINMGDKTIADLLKEAKELDAERDAIDQQFKEWKTSCNVLKDTQKEMIERTDFRRVVLSTTAEAEEKVMILEGYCPEEKEAALQQLLDAKGIFYTAEAPEEEDQKVPVKLKNSKFNNAYEIITGLYGLPNYHKTDLTPYFAPFYMLFFGFCFADSIYGVLLAGAALFFMNRVREEMQPVMRLLFYLGIAAIVMGIVTGNLGGVELDKDNFQSSLPWFQKYQNYILIPDKLFWAALIIGGVQIIFGQFVRAITYWKTDGFKHTISTWGWLILIIGLAITLGLQKAGMIGANITPVIYVILGIWFLLVFVFNHPGHNILVNIGEGVWDCYEKATGWLGDILSYIRLFAISLAGAVLASVFNKLAVGMSGDIPVVSQLIMLLILLFGHSINIFMAVLASLVHPLRLTFVEFYKNAGFVGGGKAYHPFARYKEEFKLL